MIVFPADHPACPFTRVAAGFAHAVARSSAWRARAGAGARTLTPPPHHTHAHFTESGAIFTWGLNAHGQLGVGDTRTRFRPMHVGGGRGATYALPASPGGEGGEGKEAAVEEEKGGGGGGVEAAAHTPRGTAAARSFVAVAAGANFTAALTSAWAAMLPRVPGR